MDKQKILDKIAEFEKLKSLSEVDSEKDFCDRKIASLKKELESLETKKKPAKEKQKSKPVYDDELDITLGAVTDKEKTAHKKSRTLTDSLLGF